MITDKVIGFCPTYEDLDCLKFTAPRNLKLLDKMVYLDGPFFNFAKTHLESTDGTREFIKSLDNTILYSMGSKSYVQHKTNRAFHITSSLGYKYALLLGSDEWIEGDIELFLENLNEKFKDTNEPFIVDVDFNEHNLISKWNRKLARTSRLFVNPMWIRARFTHWFYSLLNSYFPTKSIAVSGITIHHNDTLRPSKRNKMMENYQNKEVNRERTILQKVIDRSRFVKPNPHTFWEIDVTNLAPEEVYIDFTQF